MYEPCHRSNAGLFHPRAAEREPVAIACGICVRRAKHAHAVVLAPGALVLVAYNVSGERRQDCVVVDARLHRNGDSTSYLYGDTGTRTLEQADDGTLYVRLPLEPQQFVILG